MKGAEIITIGDELLRGEIIDSNKAFLSERLLLLDIETRFHTSVRDDTEDMIDAFRRAVRRSDVVLVSGGLGPTRDDKTAEAIAKAFGRELALHESALAAIRAFFDRVGREMSPNNAKQAYFPHGASVLENPIGTAPGFLVVEDGALLFCMPGVPGELRRMMDEQVLPRIASRRPGGVVVRAALLRTFGVGESSLDHQLRDVAAAGDVVLGFRTSFPDNILRPLVRAPSAAEAEGALARVCARIRERLGAVVYGEGEETLAAVVGRELRARGCTVAVAEGATGGLLSERLTALSESAPVYAGGVVSRDAVALADLLGLPPDRLAAEGPHSEAAARVLAERVRERFGADFGLATLGTVDAAPPPAAGPLPTAATAVVAVARGDGTHSGRFAFALDRARHREITVQLSLDWVRRSLLGVELAEPSLLRRSR